MTNGEMGFRHNARDLGYKPRGTGHSWFWNFGENRGQWVLLGPYNTKEDAMSIGRSSYEGFFEPYELKTIDKHAAASKIKAIRLTKGISDGIEDPMGKALQRLRHRI